MAQDQKCKICRRAGTKLFLKGERCLGSKCAMIKKAYPPGDKGKRRRRPLSEYGKELKEKQKLRNWYNLRERQFKNYVQETLNQRGKTEDAPTLLIQRLESRLDNVIFRAGLAMSRKQARQLVNHGSFLVNEKPVDIPSYHVRKDDKVSVRPRMQNKVPFKEWKAKLKNYQAPSWLKLDKQKADIIVIGSPLLEEAVPPAEISSIFEFYSK